jgi:FtsH-binding integral membrane protein
MEENSKAQITPSVFYYLCVIPITLFVVGFVYATQSLDQWRPSLVCIVSVFLGGIGLIVGLRLVVQARKEKRNICGLVVATLLAGAPILLMVLLFLSIGLAGYFGR